MKPTSLSLPAKLFTFAVLGASAAAVQAQANDDVLKTLSTSYVSSAHPAGSVLKVKLDTKLQSNKAKVGEIFTATIDTEKSNNYFGLPAGTKVEGHVSAVQARSGSTPGKMSLDFDSVRLATGEKYPISASLIKFDSKSVLKEDGRYMATPAYRHVNTSYIATGAVVGIGAAILLGGDVLTGGILGAIVGYFIGENGGLHAQDVSLKQGTVLGVRFDQDAKFNIVVWN